MALSLLLGSHPPRLPVSALTAAGELFGVSSGAMRTALSRMTTAGEVMAIDASYTLAGRFVERQAHQDHGRRPVESSWNGEWVTVTPRQVSRSNAERRELRRQLGALRLGELRPDYWLRPANFDLGQLESVSETLNLITVVGVIVVENPAELVNQLWSPDEFVKQASELRIEMTRLVEARDHIIESDEQEKLDSWLVDAFTSAAEVVRFLTGEPRLPAELVASPWEPNLLRQDYDNFERIFQHQLAEFFRTAAKQAT